MAWSKTPLHRWGNHLVGRLPARWQRVARRAKHRARLAAGEELVPPAELESTYRDALAILGSDADGDYLEFGVYLGTSMLCMHRALAAAGNSTMRLIGFDSFEGLPPTAAVDDAGVWEPGQYDADIDVTREQLTKGGIDWGRTILVPGWYDETLTPELRERLELRKASVVMVDCDMYLSARAALEFIEPLILDRAVIVFDDWHTEGLADRDLGERRAFDELLATAPLRVVRELESYGPTAHVVLVERTR